MSNLTDIIEQEIDKLLFASKSGEELTLDQIRKLDLLHKNLLLVQGNPTEITEAKIPTMSEKEFYDLLGMEPPLAQIIPINNLKVVPDDRTNDNTTVPTAAEDNDKSTS